jgi:hypothetical protein
VLRHASPLVNANANQSKRIRLRTDITILVSSYDATEGEEASGRTLSRTTTVR